MPVIPLSIFGADRLSIEIKGSCICCSEGKNAITHYGQEAPVIPTPARFSLFPDKDKNPENTAKKIFTEILREKGVSEKEISSLLSRPLTGERVAETLTEIARKKLAEHSNDPLPSVTNRSKKNISRVRKSNGTEAPFRRKEIDVTVRLVSSASEKTIKEITNRVEKDLRNYVDPRGEISTRTIRAVVIENLHKRNIPILPPTAPPASLLHSQKTVVL